MRILLVNWAPLASGAAVGGGVNGYCQGLAQELSRRGHRVSYVSSGVAYTRALDVCRVPTVERRAEMGVEGGRAIEVHEIVDSPVVAPAVFQFVEPALEGGCAPLESVFGALVSRLAPDVVHFHNIEGLSAGCVGAAARAGARVVFSLHNYHTVCPQVYLMRRACGGDGLVGPLGVGVHHERRVPCVGFENGHACVGCVRTHGPAEEVRRRVGLDAGGGGGAERGGVSVSGGADVGGADVGGAGRGLPIIDNAIAPEPASSREPNAYAARRAAMVAALSSCDAVLAVSSFVARKFVAMGVEGAVVRELAIGTRMVELAAEYRARGAMEEPAGVIGSGAGRGAGSGGDRPLTLAFLGYHNFYKGLHVLTDAVALLDEATARRVALVVHAKDVDGARPTLAALAARCASVVVEGGYEYARVPEILGAAGVDVGVVPSVWWDNGPQTVMEYLACGVPVLGAAVGGIPDVVREGENGLLFRGGDAGDLARRIAECVGNREMVAGLKARVAASRGMLMTMGAHCARLEEVYGEVVSRGWRGREGA